MSACGIWGGCCEKNGGGKASKTRHNEKAMNWNASPIIEESEFPARKIFSR